MTTPTGSGPDQPQNDPSQGQQGWGAPPPPAPGYGQPPAYGQAPGYGQPPAYGQGYAAAPGYFAPPPAAPQVGFADAVRTVLTQYANFQGRARRSEFWFFVLAWAIAYVVVAMIDQILFGALILTVIFIVATIIPYLAVSVRRLHDTDRSGWWLLLNLIPFGGIVTLVFECMDSTPGPNRYGPSPKYQGAPGY